MYKIFKKIDNIINIGFESYQSVLTPIYSNSNNFQNNFQNISNKTLINTSNVSNKVKLDLYSCIYDKSLDYEKIYHFLMTNFGAEKIDVMIRLLGKPFIDWSISESKNIDKLFECNFIISDYSSKLETNTDPIVLGLTIIGKFRDILL